MVNILNNLLMASFFRPQKVATWCVYDANSGRFVREDDWFKMMVVSRGVGIDDEVNWFGYVMGNPVMLIDPKGKNAWDGMGSYGGPYYYAGNNTAINQETAQTMLDLFMIGVGIVSTGAGVVYGVIRAFGGGLSSFDPTYVIHSNYFFY